MVEAGELPAGPPGDGGAGRRPGAALRRRHLRPGHRRRRCSSTSPTTCAAMRELARVLRPGGAMAVTVPRCVPEAVNWALSDEYHDTPGRPRPHLPALHAGAPAAARPDCEPTGSTTPTACTRPTGGCAASWARRNDSHPAVAAYHKVLVWDIVKAPFVTRTADRVLNPLIGKSLVLYLSKPARQRRRICPTPRPTCPAACRGGAGRRHRSQGARHDHRRDPHPTRARPRGARHPDGVRRAGHGACHRRRAAPRRA